MSIPSKTEWLQGSDWECVHHRGSQESTERLRITAGWLYRVRVRNHPEPDSLALTFVPDFDGAPLRIP